MKLKILILIKQVLVSCLDVKLSVKTSYKIFKFIKQIENEELYYNSALKEIFNTFAIKDDNGKLVTNDKGNIKISENNIGICQDAIYELDNLEVEVPNISFTLTELDPLKLSVNQIILLQNFIQEDK